MNWRTNITKVSSRLIIGMFLLAAGWLISGLILEKVFGASFFTEESTITYWVIFFGILIALFAGMIIGIFQDIDWTGQKHRAANSLCVCKITAPVMEGMIEEIVDHKVGEDTLFIRRLPKNRLGLSNELGFFVVKIPHDFKEGDIVKVEVGENKRIKSVIRTGDSVSFFVRIAYVFWIILFCLVIVFLNFVRIANTFWIILFCFIIVFLIVLKWNGLLE